MKAILLACAGFTASLIGQVTQPLAPNALVISASFYRHGTGLGLGHVVDVNSDGKLDVVSQLNTGFAVLIGKGDGTLEAAKEVSAGVRCTSVSVGDWNQDGQADTAVVCDDLASLYLRRADGTYSKAFTVAGVSKVTQVRLTDLNGDRLLDLVVSQGYQGGSLYAFVGRGSSSLPIPSTVQLTITPWKGMYAVDFNGDRKVDLALMSDRGHMAIYWGQGDGTFRVGPVQLVGRGYFNSEVLLEDVDEDGKIDLIIPPQGFLANDLRLLYGKGDGTFEPPQLVPVLTSGWPDPSVFAPAIADLDGDGENELFVLAKTDIYGERRPFVARRLGRRQFDKFILVPLVEGLPERYIGPTVGNWVYWAHPADLDGDGRAELVLPVGQATASEDIYGIRTLKFRQAGQFPGAAVRLSSVAHGATFQRGTLSPGCIVSIFGWGLGPKEPITFTLDENGRVPNKLAGIQVLFNKIPAPLIAVSDRQINAVVPFSLSGQTSAEIEITGVAYPANKTTVALAAATPGFFRVSLRQDGNLNAEDAPSAPGDWVTFFLTGVGPLEPIPVDGGVAVTPLSRTALPYSANLLGTPVEIGYLGPAPGLIYGVWQLNVRIPSPLVVRGTVPIEIQSGTVKASTTFVLR